MLASITDYPQEFYYNKVILLRVDFNVPISNDCPPNIVDDSKIRYSLPTIKYLIQSGAKIIISTHLGKPNGCYDLNYSTENFSGYLSDALSKNVNFVNDSIGCKVYFAVSQMNPQDIILLENLHFYKEELNNDLDFAKELVKYADIYVNDAFSYCHKLHSSLVGVTHFTKIKLAGFLLVEELRKFDFINENRMTRPFTLIIGGNNTPSKLNAIKLLIRKVDNILIGGSTVYTFLAALGFDVCKALVDHSNVITAKEILDEAKLLQVNINLAEDTSIYDFTNYNSNNGYKTEVVSFKDVTPYCIGSDIGPSTITAFRDTILTSKTILWEGIMGTKDNHLLGTYEIIDCVCSVTNSDSVTVVCGRDTVEALNTSGLNHFTHIISGGGSTLQYLAGKVLPGVDALMN